MSKSVAIIGSGNWGSAIARIVGQNVQNNAKFDTKVRMYVYEEEVNGQKLSEIINTKHENVKYLPGHLIPPNVVAVTDIKETARDADILIFVVPHQFVDRLCSQMKEVIRPGAVAMSLIKGLSITDSGLQLISTMISNLLDIPCHALMGANLAPEVASENYCEATIGCKDEAVGAVLKELMQTSYFRIVVVKDTANVEMCGALKNVVACGAGFVDGLKYGDNTKAAVIRLGLMEMVKFCKMYNGEAELDTFLQSCGVADLVTTCYGGRNSRLSREMVITGKTIKELETELLNGQSLQGPMVAAEVNYYLKNRNMLQEFPLFTAVHEILVREKPPAELIECLRNHPEHM